MRVRIEDHSISLEDAQNLGSLSVVTRLIGPALEAAMGRQASGEPDPDGQHVWLEPRALRTLGSADGAWLERFEAMLRFAQAHGFADSTGRIRAHIESSSAESAPHAAPSQ